MIRSYITVLLFLISHFILGGPFAHFLNPITKQANRIDFGNKTFHVLVDKQHWVENGRISMDSITLSEIRKDAEFKFIPTNVPNQFMLFLECTNQLFSFDLTSKIIKRLDHTYFRGDNCGSFVFVRNGKYHQIGGYGFWETNNHITYYDPKIKEWEGISVTGDAPSGIYRGYAAYLPEQNKLITFSNFSNDISFNAGSLNLSNEIFEFSFLTKSWIKIGDITHPYLKDVLIKLGIERRERAIFTGKYFVIFPLGVNGHVTIIFIDPRTLGIYEYQDTEMKYARFPFINMTIASPSAFNHNEWLLGTQNANAAHLVNESQLINLHLIAKEAKFIGYLTDKPWYLTMWFLMLISSICMALFYLIFNGFYQKFKFKNASKNQISSRINHFDESQLALLNQFYHLHKNEGLDVEQVNDILGISQLGADTQRFRRSNAIKELNSKLALLTGEKNAILRISSQLDKRQKRYQLHDHVMEFVKKELSL